MRAAFLLPRTPSSRGTTRRRAGRRFAGGHHTALHGEVFDVSTQTLDGVSCELLDVALKLSLAQVLQSIFRRRRYRSVRWGITRGFVPRRGVTR